MDEIGGQGAGAGGLVMPVRVDGVFDDPGGIWRMVERNGPYRTMASFLPDAAVRGREAAAGEGVPAHFRATWAAGGRALVDGAEAILHNPRLLRAAARLFGAEATPNTLAVNIGAPTPAGAIHVDVPSFRGADRDRYPMRLLQAMAASGLFEAWRVVEAGAVIWNYAGRGGAYDYWPAGLDGPMRSIGPPFTNSALVGDNDRMYHRIGATGDPAAAPAALSVAAEISHLPGGGWTITDNGKTAASYDDRDIRISILWKARISSGAGPAVPELTPELIARVISADLAGRGVHAPGQAASLSDPSWLDLVHAAYYVPVSAEHRMATSPSPDHTGYVFQEQDHGDRVASRRRR